jgi:hypothetical protein
MGSVIFFFLVLDTDDGVGYIRLNPGNWIVSRNLKGHRCIPKVSTLIRTIEYTSTKSEVG